MPPARSATTRICRRYTSTRFSSTYHPKVRALPFAIDREEAIRQVGWQHAKVPLYANFFTAFAARFFPSPGQKLNEPLRIGAFYLPAWFIDAEVEGRIRDVSNTDNVKEMPLSVQLFRSYMPGFHFPPLSRFGIYGNTLPRESEPWSDALATQHGQAITCLPYALSPLPLLSTLKSMDSTQARISDDLRILSPHTIRADYFAAYPVLLPVYLAQYTTLPPWLMNGAGFSADDPSFRVTYILEAWSPDGRIIDNLAPALWETNKRITALTNSTITTRILSSVSPIPADLLTLSRGLPHKFASLRLLTLINPLKIFPALSEWVETLATTADLGAVPGLDNVDMDDPRVRVWTEDELVAAERWLDAAEAPWALREVLKTISAVDGAHTIRLDLLRSGKSDSIVDKEPTKLKRSLEDRVRALMTEREAIKPEWWKEYEGSVKEGEEGSRTS